MTTPYPGRKAQFYILVPQDTTEFTAEPTAVTFSLPAGTKFPDDLTQIMRKTQRYFTFKSIVLGETSPTCEGCVCTNCTNLVSYCEGEGCKGFVSSVDNIVCDNSSCTKTNDTKYYLLPLYPTNASLPHYNPKFKFIKVIPSTKIDMDKKNVEIAKGLGVSTIPPELFPLPTMVMFAVSYPSLDIFNTEDKFNELYELCKVSGVILALLKEEKYAKHNNAILEQIVKINKLPTTLLKQDIEKVAKSNSAISEDRKVMRQQQLLSKPPKQLDQKLVNRLIASIEKQASNPSASSRKPLPLFGFVKERYEGDIEIKDLVVPISEQDDTTPDILLTEEPKNPPKPKRDPWGILGIIIPVLVVLSIAYGVYKSTRPVPKKTPQKTQQLQARRRGQ